MVGKYIPLMNSSLCTIMHICTTHIIVWRAGLCARIYMYPMWRPDIEVVFLLKLLMNKRYKYCYAYLCYTYNGATRRGICISNVKTMGSSGVTFRTFTEQTVQVLLCIFALYIIIATRDARICISNVKTMYRSGVYFRTFYWTNAKCTIMHICTIHDQRDIRRVHMYIQTAIASGNLDFAWNFIYEGVIIFCFYFKFTTSINQ